MSRTLAAVLFGFSLLVQSQMALAIGIPPIGNLPPDPGAPGDATLAGIDSNANGVRDDLEVAIGADYGNNHAAREVLYHAAITYQRFLLDPLNAALEGFSFLAALGPCMASATGSPVTITEFLRPHVLNTYDRSVAYLAAKAAVGNAVLPVKNVTCSALPPDLLLSSRPSGILVPTRGATTGFTVSWQPQAGMFVASTTTIWYQLERGVDAGFTSFAETVYSGANLSHLVVGNIGTYYFRVRMCASDTLINPAGACGDWLAGANPVVVSLPGVASPPLPPCANCPPR